MFEALSDRLSSVLRKFGGQAKLTEENIQESLREVRLALLEADVNIKVVRHFTDRVRERALGQDVLKSLSPAQQVIKIVHEELKELLGGEGAGLNLKGPGPHVVMMVGLQGSGKTTSTAKLALWLKSQKMRPYLVPADVYRPAAIEQLQTLAAQLDMPVFPSSAEMDPVDIAREAVAAAKREQCTVVLVDTAGRLHIDEPLMAELSRIKDAVNPDEILFVADAMTGQDAVNVAETFYERLGTTGVVLTKMDGDARGGAALSIRTVTGTPVKFVGTGEKVSEFELFHPDRIAGRILGMGDVLTLIEKAQEHMKQEEAEELSRKLQKAEFNFEDFLGQVRRIKKMGSLDGLLKLIPGMGALREKLGSSVMPEKEMKRTEAIINSMTREERRNPKIINAKRRARIAMGSGTKVQDVNNLMRQFEQMRDMMKKMMGGGKKPTLPPMGKGAGLPGMGALGGMSGFGGLPGMPGLPGLPGMGGTPKLTKEAQKKKKEMRKREKQRRKKR